MQLLFLGLSMWVTMFMEPIWAVGIYSIFMGFMKGSGGPFDGAVWANLFGRKYLGEIRGFIATVLAASTALGPVLLGRSYDLTGGYSPALWFGILWCVIGGITSLRVKHPTKPTEAIA